MYPPCTNNDASRDTRVDASETRRFATFKGGLLLTKKRQPVRDLTHFVRRSETQRPPHRRGSRPVVQAPPWLVAPKKHIDTPAHDVSASENPKYRILPKTGRRTRWDVETIVPLPHSQPSCPSSPVATLPPPMPMPPCVTQNDKSASNPPNHTLIGTDALEPKKSPPPTQIDDAQFDPNASATCDTCAKRALDRAALDLLPLCAACLDPWQTWPKIVFSRIQERAMAAKNSVDSPSSAPAVTLSDTPLPNDNNTSNAPLVKRKRPNTASSSSTTCATTSSRKKKIVPPKQSRGARRASASARATPKKKKVAPSDIAPQPTFAANAYHYTFGQPIEVLNINGHWYTATLVDCDDIKVKVHYKDWHDQDEWINMGSKRLRDPTTQSTTTEPEEIDVQMPNPLPLDAAKTQENKNSAPASPHKESHAPPGSPSIVSMTSDALTDISDDDDLFDFLDNQDTYELPPAEPCPLFETAAAPPPMRPKPSKVDDAALKLDKDHLFNATDVLMTRRMVQQMVDKHGFGPNAFGYQYGRAVAVTYDTIGQPTVPNQPPAKRQQMEWVGYLREMRNDKVRVYFPESQQADWVRTGSRRLRLLTDEEDERYRALGYDVHADAPAMDAPKRVPRVAPKKKKPKNDQNESQNVVDAPLLPILDKKEPSPSEAPCADADPTAEAVQQEPGEPGEPGEPEVPEKPEKPEKEEEDEEEEEEDEASAPLEHTYTTTGAFATRRALRQLQDEHGFVPNAYGYEYNRAVEVLNTRSSKHHQFFWERGHLVAMKPGKICVRYDGWADFYDEWFMVGSRRIRLASNENENKQNIAKNDSHTLLLTTPETANQDVAALETSRHRDGNHNDGLVCPETPVSGELAHEKPSRSGNWASSCFLAPVANPEIEDEARTQRKHKVFGLEDYYRLGMALSIEELQAREAARIERKRKHALDRQTLPIAEDDDDDEENENDDVANQKRRKKRRKGDRRRRTTRSTLGHYASESASNSDDDDDKRGGGRFHDHDDNDDDENTELDAHHHGFVANVYGYDYMQHVRVLHLDKKWYEARLLLMDRNRVKIHYCGWPDLFDEFVVTGSRRLQVLENDHQVICAEPTFPDRYKDLLRTKRTNDYAKDASKPVNAAKPFKLRRWTLDDMVDEDQNEGDDNAKVVCQLCNVKIKQFRYYCTYCEGSMEDEHEPSYDLCLKCFDQSFPIWHEHPRSSFAVQSVIDTEIGPRPIKGELVTVWEEDVMEAAANTAADDEQQQQQQAHPLEASQIFTGDTAIQDEDKGFQYIKQWHRRKVCAFCNDDDDMSEDLGKFIGPFVITAINRNGLLIKRTFWAHDACARHSPEVFCTPDGKWYNVTLALRRGRKVRCFACKEKGATIGCFETKCNKSFHLSCAQKPVNYFKNGVIFWCPTHEAYYNKIDTYVNVFNCDGCGKQMEDESWYTCLPCASDYFSSFDLCGECFDNFPSSHPHGEDHFEETSLAIIKEMEAQKATAAARAKEEACKTLTKACKRPKFLKRRRRRADGTLPVSCCYCGTQSAEEWRKGYDGGVLMCAACYNLALLVDNDGRDDKTEAGNDDIADADADSRMYILPPASKDIYGMDLQDKYVASIDDYTHKPYLTRDTLSATKFSDAITGSRLATYEPQPHQMFSLIFNTTYYDIPGRAPRWATHSGTDYHGTWLPQTVRRAIRLYTRENERVLSNFLGRGTDAIECFLLHRRCFGIDINPAAVALSQRNCCFELPVGLTEAKYRPIIAQADARQLSGSMFGDEAFHHILSHPPYKDCVAYSTNLEGDLSRFTNIEDFKKEYKHVVKESWRLLKMGRRVTLGIGDNREHCFYVPVSFNLMRQYIDAGFEMEELIVKRQRYCSAFGLGTYLCVQFDFLVFTHEFIATFRKIPMENIDRMTLPAESAVDKAPTVQVTKTMHGIPPSAVLRKSVVMGTVWVFKPTENYPFPNVCTSRVVERFGKDDCNWMHLSLHFSSPEKDERDAPRLVHDSERDSNCDVVSKVEMSNYELDRLRRIEQNNKTLLQLGLISELSDDTEDKVHYDTMMSKPAIADAPLWLMVCAHPAQLEIDQISAYRRTVKELAREACTRLHPQGMFIVGTQDVRDKTTGRLWPMTLLILEDIESAVDRSVLKLKELVVAVPDGHTRNRKMSYHDAMDVYQQCHPEDNSPDPNQSKPQIMVLHKGSCHCGNLKFTVEAPEELVLNECDCSICFKQGARWYHVPKEDFTLDPTSQLSITEYQYNTKVAIFYFCKTCGIHPFHKPRENPDKNMAINFRCVDGDTLKSFTIDPCDGQNW
ncbi:hypothetical protein BC940DRAFT_336987 [Gongronella butleri]|nr:hypothetical protein BC940DRAFT_336987 [Gongronella butleri]